MGSSTDPHPGSILRKLPQVDRLLVDPLFDPLIHAHSRAEVLEQVRLVLDDLRARGAKGLIAEAAKTASSKARVAAAPSTFLSR